jgi:3,4-dihydroxy 2-butanone 4-phosphate synthase/GTP cyclohydrolase II
MKAIKVATAKLPSDFGTFTIIPFESEDKRESAVALVFGSFEPDVDTIDAPLIRIHSQCLTGEAFSSQWCDCGNQLGFALEAIANAGVGILVNDLQEIRGIGRLNKLQSFELQDAGRDVVEPSHQHGFKADNCHYEFISEILLHFGLRRIRLISDTSDAIRILESHGISFVERVPLEITPVGTQNKLRKSDELSRFLTGV